MFDVLALIFRYIFIGLIYLFMLAIIRLIYLDIRNLRVVPSESGAYLKLVNRIDSIPYKIKEEYSVSEEVTIGRVGGNSIVLRDPYVSKKHARVYYQDNSYCIEDLGSSNGTYVNNRRISEITRISHGDRIKIGQIEFLFVNEN